MGVWVWRSRLALLDHAPQAVIQKSLKIMDAMSRLDGVGKPQEALMELKVSSEDTVPAAGEVLSTRIFLMLCRQLVETLGNPKISQYSGIPPKHLGFVIGAIRDLLAELEKWLPTETTRKRSASTLVIRTSTGQSNICDDNEQQPHKRPRK